MVKTGSQHVRTLKDGRQVFINRQLAGDVTEHPSFRRTVQSIAMLYDFQSRPENAELMTFAVPDGGGRRANRIWQLPHSYQDLVERRKALKAWCELHAGFSAGRRTMSPRASPACSWASRCSRAMTRRGPALLPTTIDLPATTSSTSPTSSSIPRPIARGRRASSRTRCSPQAWSTKMAGA